jgi:hypothetical protein
LYRCLLVNSIWQIFIKQYNQLCEGGKQTIQVLLMPIYGMKHAFLKEKNLWKWNKIARNKVKMKTIHLDDERKNLQL